MPDGTFYITTLQTTAYPTKEKDNNTTSDSREIDKNIDDDTLIKHNVTVADSGRYTCVAANAEGYTYKSAWITVLPIPPDTGNYGDILLTYHHGDDNHIKHLHRKSHAI